MTDDLEKIRTQEFADLLMRKGVAAPLAELVRDQLYRDLTKFKSVEEAARQTARNRRSDPLIPE